MMDITSDEHCGKGLYTPNCDCIVQNEPFLVRDGVKTMLRDLEMVVKGDS